MTSDTRYHDTQNPKTSIQYPESSIQKISLPRSSPVLTGGSEREAEPVKTCLDELVEILDAELYQYRELLRLLHAQRKSFATKEISSFEEISKHQETVALKIKTLEEARKAIADGLPGW